MFRNEIDTPHAKLIESTAKSAQLLVFFAGTNKTDGMFDFWRVGNQQSAHKLFFNNGENLWYQQGVPGIAESAGELAREIERVANSVGAADIVLHGVSMGGYAAALFAMLIGCRAMAFGFDSVLRRTHSRSAQIPPDAPLVFPDLREVAAATGAEILHISGEADGFDLLSASELLGRDGVTTKTLRGVAHGGAPFIDQRYGLADFIARHAARRPLPVMLEEGRAAHRVDLARLLVEAQIAVQKEKDWHAAQFWAEAALDIDPACEAAHCWLGISLLERKEPIQAQRSLSMALASAPHYGLARYRLARAFMATGDFDRAKFHLTEHEKNAPGAPLAPVFLSDIYRAEGNRALADDYLLKAYRIDPLNPSVTSRLAKHAVSPE